MSDEREPVTMGIIPTLILMPIALAWMAVIICLPFAILWWIFS